MKTFDISVANDILNLIKCANYNTLIKPYDDNRKKTSIGDFINIMNTDTKEKITVLVKNVRVYSTIEELYLNISRNQTYYLKTEEVSSNANVSPNQSFSAIEIELLSLAKISELMLSNFLDQRKRLIQLPSKYNIKIYAYFYLASKLEKNRRYSESEINDVINDWTTFRDAATLRRILYNTRFINRTLDGREYWVEEKEPTLADLARD